jgi:hypothetical protein
MLPIVTHALRAPHHHESEQYARDRNSDSLCSTQSILNCRENGAISAFTIRIRATVLSSRLSQSVLARDAMDKRAPRFDKLA